MRNNAEAAASKFVRAIVRKVAEEESPQSLDVEQLLRRAIEDLPAGRIRALIESDSPRFSSLLSDALRSVSVPVDVEGLLDVSKGSVVSNEASRKAVEALVLAAERGAGERVDAEEWIASCRRLLASGKRVPLALWWTYSALEVQHAVSSLSAPGHERESLVLSTAKLLFSRLKSLSAGRVDAYTAISVLAPVVASLYQAYSILRSNKSSLKHWKKALKTLKQLVEEVLGSIATFSHRLPEIPVDIPDEELTLDFRGLVLVAKGINKLSGRETDTKGLGAVYPLSSKEVRKSSTLHSRPMEFWAGVVAAEAVLMALLVKLLSRKEQIASNDFVQELKHLAVHSSALNTDSLIYLTMEAKLPVTNALAPEEENLLRAALYEALLVDPPFANGDHSSSKSLRSFVLKLALCRRAVQFYRSHDERTKSIAILSRVGQLTVPPGFLKCLQSAKLKQKLPEDVYKDSGRLIGWLTQTADDGTMASIMARVSPNQNLSKAKIDLKQTTAEEGDDMFFLDTKGRPGRADKETADRAFALAAEEMREEMQSNHAYGKTVALSGDESLSSDEEESDTEHDAQPNVSQQVEWSADALKDSVEAALASSIGQLEAAQKGMGEATTLEKDVVATAITTKLGDAEAEVGKVDGVATEILKGGVEEHAAGAAVGVATTTVKETAAKTEQAAFETVVVTETGADCKGEVKPFVLAEVETPTVDTPRFTRSGRKYGNYQAPSTESTKKRRRICI